MLKFSRLSSRKWTNIIIHHSYSPDADNTFQWNDIERWHVKENKWSAIGYHYGIEHADNGKLIYCVGRGLDCMGAHTNEKDTDGVSMNEKGIGIVLVGNFDAVEPTDTQIWFLAELCKDLMRDFQIPIENIHPHRQYAQKSCPGARFDMNRLYAKIKENGYKTPESVDPASGDAVNV